MLKVTKKYNGEILKQWQLEEISNNFLLTKHARKRILERNIDIDIKNLILNPVIAYFNYDGSINIALNDYEYIVVIPDIKSDIYKIITYKEPSENQISIYQKWQLARVGWKRKNDKKWKN